MARAQPGGRRAFQAEATRADILRAARGLFAERGYASASMVEVAEAAGVALQTVYARVGSKRELVLALVDAIDEEVGVPELRQRLSEETNPRRRLELMIGITRRFQEETGDVVGALASAAPSEPDAAAALAEGRRRHRRAAGLLVEPIAKAGKLRPGLTADEAADVFTALTSDRMYASLRDLGWSFDRCEEWIASTARTLLLGRR